MDYKALLISRLEFIEQDIARLLQTDPQDLDASSAIAELVDAHDKIFNTAFGSNQAIMNRLNKFTPFTDAHGVKVWIKDPIPFMREYGYDLELDSYNNMSELYKFHREDGPAIISPYGTKEYYLDGVEYTEEAYNQELRNRQFNDNIMEGLKDLGDILNETE